MLTMHGGDATIWAVLAILLFVVTVLALSWTAAPSFDGLLFSPAEENAMPANAAAHDRVTEPEMPHDSRETETRERQNDLDIDGRELQRHEPESTSDKMPPNTPADYEMNPSEMPVNGHQPDQREQNHHPELDSRELDRHELKSTHDILPPSTPAHGEVIAPEMAGNGRESGDRKQNGNAELDSRELDRHEPESTPNILLPSTRARRAVITSEMGTQTAVSTSKTSTQTDDLKYFYAVAGGRKMSNKLSTLLAEQRSRADAAESRSEDLVRQLDEAKLQLCLERDAAVKERRAIRDPIGNAIKRRYQRPSQRMVERYDEQLESPQRQDSPISVAQNTAEVERRAIRARMEADTDRKVEQMRQEMAREYEKQLKLLERQKQHVSEELIAAKDQCRAMRTRIETDAERRVDQVRQDMAKEYEKQLELLRRPEQPVSNETNPAKSECRAILSHMDEIAHPRASAAGQGMAENHEKQLDEIRSQHQDIPDQASVAETDCRAIRCLIDGPATRRSETAGKPVATYDRNRSMQLQSLKKLFSKKRTTIETEWRAARSRLAATVYRRRNMAVIKARKAAAQQLRRMRSQIQISSDQARQELQGAQYRIEITLADLGETKTLAQQMQNQYETDRHQLLETQKQLVNEKTEILQQLEKANAAQRATKRWAEQTQKDLDYESHRAQQAENMRISEGSRRDQLLLSATQLNQKHLDRADQAEESLRKAEKEKADLRKQLKKAKEEIEVLEKELGEAKEELAVVEEEYENADQKNTELGDDLEEAKEFIAELKEKLEDYRMLLGEDAEDDDVVTKVQCRDLKCGWVQDASKSGRCVECGLLQ